MVVKKKTKRKVARSVTKKRTPVRRKKTATNKKTAVRKKRAATKKAGGASKRRLIIAALDHYGKVHYFDGVKYHAARANAAEYGSLEAAQRQARQLSKLAMMRLTGVFMSTDSEASIREDFSKKL